MYVYIENMFQTHCVFVFDQTTRPQLAATLTRWFATLSLAASCAFCQQTKVASQYKYDSRFTLFLLACFSFFSPLQIWWKLHIICALTSLLSRRSTHLGASSWTRLMHRYIPMSCVYERLSHLVCLPTSLILYIIPK